ncbi:MAG TPA: RluA family pseudouridine synthase [Syntrophales bacterium]|nr:RluA family pseudouridine synthase [Syntrophales bacterium]
MTRQEGTQSRYIVGENEQGLRLDVFLSQTDKDLSRSQAKRLIEEGDVLVEGKSARGSRLLKLGETVSLHKPPPVSPEIVPEDIPLDILYEDDSLIVVDKPPGMVVHPAAGNYGGTLVNALQFHCRDLSGIGGVMRPGIVHRLDKGTSGLMVVAKSDEAHRHLSEQFKNRQVSKQYTALVHGNLRQDEGVVDAPVGRHPVERKKMSTKSRRGKEAITRWRVLERFGDFTLVEAKIDTGRTHQIRVHLSSLGHPVVGDSVYGGSKRTVETPEMRAVVKKLTRQALHAGRLSFAHPVTGQEMTFESPLPEDMDEVIRYLRSASRNSGGME